MIRITCACGKQIQTQDEHAGRSISCPECGRDILIPDADEVMEATAAATPASPRPSDHRREETSHGDKERELDDDEAGPSKTSRKAIASLILGIASFLCTIFTGVPALVLGVLSLIDISRSRGRLSGQGLAIGGMVTGALGMVISGMIVPLLVGLLLPAMQKIRDAAVKQQTVNNLRMIGLAMHQYHQTQGSFPPAAVHDDAGKPLYSWRVLLLPYLEQESLYKQFKLDEPWDSPNNLRLLAQMPRVYRHPRDAAGNDSSTVYQALVGKGAAFEGVQGLHLKDFTDGASNTILLAEAAQAVPWTKPDDLAYAPDKPLPLFNDSTGSFNALFADGSARTVPAHTKEWILRAMITRNGAEVLPAGW
jgi:prepilin-type processing-associated H-X9-DG protein